MNYYITFYDVQMKQKVKRLTDTFMAEGGGDQDVAAQLFANFTSQRAIKPFVQKSVNSPQTKFGENVLATLKQARKVSLKPGSKPDLFRRAIVVAGACGPMSSNPVCVINNIISIMFALMTITINNNNY